MKKIISLILCIAVLALVLVSCGDEEHVHQYNRNEWKFDATNHWYAPACDCEDAENINVAKHYDTMNDGKCDICNYLMCSNTAHGDTLKYNENSHWKEPVCGHNGQDSHILPGEFSEHTYNDAGLCTTVGCGYQCVKTDYKEAWSTDANNHWHDPACGHTHLPVVDSAAHVDVDENEDGEPVGNGVCDVCGYVMCSVPVKEAGESDEDFQERLDAFYNAEPSYDENQHWYEPVCGHVGHDLKDLGVHAEAEEGADGFCDVCFQEIPEADDEE